MPTVIDKILNIFTKQSRKLPQAMIIVFIFAFLFPSNAAKLVDIIAAKAQILLPESFSSRLAELPLSQEDFLAVWGFLLIIYAITFLLTAFSQSLKGYPELVLGMGGELLLEVNSIIFLFVLIYNSLYSPEIKIPIHEFGSSGLYSCFVSVSSLLFAMIFVGTYCTDIFLIYKKINDSEFSLSRQIVLRIIFSIVVIAFLVKLSYILFL